MSRSDIPDDAKVIESLEEGHKDEAAHRLLEDLQTIEHGLGTPKQKLTREKEYLGQLQGDALRDGNLQRLGFSGFSEMWNDDGKGHRSSPKLVSDTNHNRVLDSGDLQVDLNGTVVGDELTGRALKDRSQSSPAGAGELKALTPKSDTPVGDQTPAQGNRQPRDGTLQGKVDASGEASQPKLFQLGAEHTFVKSGTTETLPDGRTVDWTKWHHDLVLAAKHEFEQLLADSPALKAKAGEYGPMGSLKLQFDVTRDGRIQLRGLEGETLYGGDPSTTAQFEAIARQTVERLEHRPGLTFPAGSRRSVNSTELQIGLNTGNSAKWKTNDSEQTGR